jgi:hypothetical protein
MQINTRKAWKIGWKISLAILVLAAVAGCSGLLGGAPAQPGQQETSVALTIAAYPFPTAAVKATQPQQPSDAAQPTYTPLPTYTMAPTFTPLPTYTELPTYTPLAPPTLEQVVAAPVNQPTAVSVSGRPYTLRVRNANIRSTYWIGTSMPYGGNFIKPLYYVEFYPPQPTWMRIWWCGRTYYRYFPNGWYQDWYSNWNNSSDYTCRHFDIMVDQPYVETSVN